MPRCPNPRCQRDCPPGSVQCSNPYCLCLLPEAIVAGRYRIETLIGIGGMGAVYRASDTFKMEQVALKILSLVNNGNDAETAVERFRREARYAYQIKHKNIVPIVNFGQDGTLLYLEMPLVSGGTLKSLLRAEHPLPTAQARQYINDLADAIDAVHAHPQQIVHRDIKPSNLLISQNDGHLLLADFGIARAMQKEKALTQRGWALGTEHYTAPEQEHGNPQPASDIYSMGVVAYQIFTGLLPFQAVIKSHASELPPPSTLNSWLPTAVDPVILRAMDIEPQKRYPSGRAFADALNVALTSEDTLPAIEDMETMIAKSDANVVVRTIVLENPCGQCGRENRSGSRFCRYCGHVLDDTSPLVTSQIGYFSDAGRQARENEDMLLILQGLCINLVPPPCPFGVFAVADGLRGKQGNSAGGHEASRLAVETVADVLLPLLTITARSTTRFASKLATTPMGAGNQLSRPFQIPLPNDTILEQWLRDAVQQANRVIYHYNADFDTNMACTLTVALMFKRRLYIASVGDSRAYHYSAQEGLRCLTTDHTLGAQLVQAQLLQPDELYDSGKRNHHYRYLGHNYQMPVDLFQCELERDDLILLCTDGLWHMVRDERLAELLSHGGNLQQLAQTLVATANDAGGEGNTSAIVIGVQ